ncbi:hypothetical protein BJ165DRAFT_1583068 [Panaeolus papilionaceus]|nr:hypothetical protein BJ165DRAFT_1583068 [Panaeolus papilionaceus]
MSRARPHGKKRHPSYIPRPPNAFILFRSAFIREQNVPGKVEGNHSKLSKIIGMCLCWKKLSAQERSHWEAQAVIAQAEHRAKYPDWRFSPGSNAQVKREHKEAAASTSTRKKAARSRLKNSMISVEEEDEGDDGPEGSVENVESAGESSKAKDGKGKGKAKNTTRAQSFEEKRYQKIAGFVADGLKGDELDIALKEWEFEKKVTRPVKPAGRSKSIRGTQANSSTATSSSHTRSRSDNIFSKLHLSASPIPPNSESSSSTPTGHQQDVKAVIDDTPMDTSPSILSNVPLTHMYKRSTSAPATNNRLAILPTSSAQEMASEDEGASSSDDPPSASLSPTSAEHSPGTWKPLEVIVLKEATSGVSSPPPPQSQAQTLSRSHAMSPNQMSEPRSPGAGTINTFPSIPPRSSINTSSSPRDGQLTWQDAENQRRLDEIREPINWWSSQRGVADAGDLDTTSSAGGSPAHRFMEPLDVSKSKGENGKSGLASTSGMGYDISGSTTHYSNGGYIEVRRVLQTIPFNGPSYSLGYISLSDRMSPCQILASMLNGQISRNHLVAERGWSR